MAPVIVIPKHVHTLAAASLGGVLLAHFLIDDGIPPSFSSLEIDEKQRRIKVPLWITADFHCPWSFLARRSLQIACERYPEVELEIKWHPMVLHTTVPVVGGMPMKEWADRSMPVNYWNEFSKPDNPLHLRAQQLGAELNLSPKQLIGSTINAHRVSYQVLDQLGPKEQDEVVQAIYSAFFQKRLDITSPFVLADIAADIGLDRDDVLRYLHTELDRTLISKMTVDSRENLNIKASPQMNFACRVRPLVGIHSPDTYSEVLGEYSAYLKQELNNRGITRA
ncbi:hypothetical protein DIPPA_09366 [Diplonema papillatum]|nr:hypothetical protein DIPPA_09366 [Diplonema papillatum]